MGDENLIKRAEDLPLIMTPADVAAVMRVSKNNAYAVVHSKGFPAKRIGSQYRILRSDFLVWLAGVNEVELKTEKE